MPGHYGKKMTATEKKKKMLLERLGKKKKGTGKKK
jgi:hypothetical protein